MKNIFYLIWVDAIVGFRNHNPTRTDWKIALFIIQTTCNALNLWTILLWLKYFEIFSFIIKIDIFPGTILNSAAGFIVQFASPFILLNYFLIFYNDRYEKLIEKYPHKKGKLAMIYTICSALIGFVSMILYGTLK
ncbi:MAG: hypothetical protein AB2L24_27670 [Mangrovibacterium sp.]